MSLRVLDVEAGADPFKAEAAERRRRSSRSYGLVSFQTVTRAGEQTVTPSCTNLNPIFRAISPQPPLIN